MKSVFKPLSWFSYAAMVAVYARSHLPERALAIISEMKEQQLPVGAAPYSYLLAHFLEVGNVARFRDTWKLLLQDPTAETEPATAAVALRFFRKQEDFGSCEQIYDILSLYFCLSFPSALNFSLSPLTPSHLPCPQVSSGIPSAQQRLTIYSGT